MKIPTFLSLTVCIQIISVFLQIHKQSVQVKMLYNRQRYETEKDVLIEQKKMLLSTLNALRAPSAVLARAEKELELRPVNLKQVRPLTYENSANL